MNRRHMIALAIGCLSLVSYRAAAQPMTAEQRREYRQKFMSITPNNPPFNEWVEKTDALPPDYESLPKINSLPDPLLFVDGKRTVKTAEDWNQRRAEIIKYEEMYDIGRVPPKPTLDKVVEIDPAVAAAEAAARGGRFGGGRGRGGPATGPATGPVAAGGGPATAPAGRGGGRGFGRGPAPAPGSITRVVDLHYGPGSQIVSRVTLTIPPGNGPFPVLMGGGAGVTSQGYISCAYNQSVDDPGRLDIGKYYPDYDFGSMGQTALEGMMVVDFLYTVPQVDKKCIAITGYSRTGKMAAITAMLDERIAACVAGSTGVGGVLPWRSASERGSGEGIETTTRNFPIWFAKQLRFFSGREDRLPVDGNLIEAAIAPRSVMTLYGWADQVGNVYGNEAAFYSAQRIYSLLGVPDRHGLLHPPGHHGANDQDATMHWLDIQFGRSKETWQNDYLFPWNFSNWKTGNQETVDLGKYPAHQANDVLGSVNSTSAWEAKAADVRKSIEWMLGSKEGGSGGPDPKQITRDDPVNGVVDWAINSGNSYGWLQPQKGLTEYRSITFGQGTRGELYYPKGTAPDAKLPTVIWLHGFSYPMGYMWVYRQPPDLHPILALVRAGYAVFAFDQTGHGSRTDEFKTFFDRFPHWSRLGRMVEDTRAAIDAIQKEGMCDGSKVYLYGYSMGGIVGLHTAALEPRVKGVVSICGFTPMRTDTMATGTGGLARYSLDLPMMPRLGFFVGNESKVPYDYNELIATIAPRPVYVMQPELDRDANVADVQAAVEQAGKIFSLYNASDKLKFDKPWDYNRLPEASQDRIVEWMKVNLR